MTVQLKPGEHYIVLKQGADDQWYWHKCAANHEIVASSEGYVEKHGALVGAVGANPDVPKIWYQDELTGEFADAHPLQPVGGEKEGGNASGS
jgi:uncharacterized protein YegP (UPF0339 family)